LVFWFAVLPAFLSFGLIAFAVSEPEPDPSREAARNPLNRMDFHGLCRPVLSSLRLAICIQ
ncbi:MAG: hypothetical protein EOO88_52530, partial [Pedobacter sp.]